VLESRRIEGDISRHIPIIPPAIMRVKSLQHNLSKKRAAPKDDPLCAQARCSGPAGLVDGPAAAYRAYDGPAVFVDGPLVGPLPGMTPVYYRGGNQGEALSWLCLAVKKPAWPVQLNALFFPGPGPL
jgi:hypothetical protein